MALHSPDCSYSASAIGAAGDTVEACIRRSSTITKQMAALAAAHDTNDQPRSAHDNWARFQGGGLPQPSGCHAPRDALAPNAHHNHPSERRRECWGGQADFLLFLFFIFVFPPSPWRHSCLSDRLHALHLSQASPTAATSLGQRSAISALDATATTRQRCVNYCYIA